MSDAPLSDEALRTDVSLLEAVSLEVGLIIGAGLFSLTGVATGIAGTAVFLSYVLSFGIVVLALLPTAMLGSAYPTTGGNYRYPSRLWSPDVAFLSAWGLAISMLAGGLPLYALSFGQYASDVFPVTAIPVGAVALTVFYVINLVGIKFAARVQLLMFVALVGSLGSFIIWGVPAVETANLTPLFPLGIGGVVTGAAILYFVCLGANFVVDIGDEITEATTTIPKSFAISVPLVLILYVLTGFVAVGSVGWELVAGTTLSEPARMILPTGIATVFIVAGALFAIATTINAVFIIAPKYLMVLAEDRLFPAFVADVNTRFGTPHWGLTIIYFISFGALLSPLPLEQLGSLLGFGGIFLVVPVMVAAVTFARNRPAVYRQAPFHMGRTTLYVVVVAAILLNTVLFVMLAIESTRMFGVWAGAMIVGGGYYALRRWSLRRQGIDFSNSLTGLDPGSRSGRNHPVDNTTDSPAAIDSGGPETASESATETRSTEERTPTDSTANHTER